MSARRRNGSLSRLTAFDSHVPQEGGAIRKQITLLAAIAVIYAPTALAAQTPQSGTETYEWSGELVSVDETTGTATIKARLVDQEGVTDLKRFKAGERVALWWSGSDRYADTSRRTK